MTELEEQIPFRVPAVVNKDIDARDVVEHAAQAAATRSANVGPAGPELFGYGGADLLMEVATPRRGQVDAPEMTGTDAVEGLENESCRKSTPDAGFENRRRPTMVDDGPDSADESRLTVSPSAECTAA